jgi:hypothetical protein
MIKIFVITKSGQVEHQHLPRILHTMQRCSCDTDRDIFYLSYNLSPVLEYLEEKNTFDPIQKDEQDSTMKNVYSNNWYNYSKR